MITRRQFLQGMVAVTAVTATTGFYTFRLETYWVKHEKRPLPIKTCLYTLTPDQDFVIDTLPDNPDVAVVVGAGHAFKFPDKFYGLSAYIQLKT